MPDSNLITIDHHDGLVTTTIDGQLICNGCDVAPTLRKAVRTARAAALHLDHKQPMASLDAWLRFDLAQTAWKTEGPHHVDPHAAVQDFDIVETDTDGDAL